MSGIEHVESGADQAAAGLLALWHKLRYKRIAFVPMVP
jgi:hypothetical protein